MSDPRSPSTPDTTPSSVPRFGRPRPKHRLRPADIHQFVEKLVGDDYHALRVLSLGNALTGVVHAATLGVHAIGQGLAQAQGLEPRHAIKQVDRILSNSGIGKAEPLKQWVSIVTRHS